MSGSTATRIAGWMILVSIPLVALGGVLFAFSFFPTGSSSLDAGWSLGQLAVLAGGGGVLLLGVLTGTLGLVLYVLIPALSSPERARWDYGSHRVVLACTLLAAIAGNILAALYLIPSAFVFGSSGGSRGALGQLSSPASIAASAIALDLALVAVVYLRVVRPGAVSWARMGLQREKLGSRLLLGLPLGFVLLVVSVTLEYVLNGLGIRQTQSQIFGSVRGASLFEFGLVLLAGAVLAPIAEEIYFRGFVFRAYLDQKGLRRAFIFSAALFALVHLNLPALLPILAIGLMLSYFYYRIGSIVPGIVAHGLNNTAAFLLLYLGFQ